MNNQDFTFSRISTKSFTVVVKGLLVMIFSFLLSSVCFAQQYNLTGTVKYADGEEIIGATVQVKGTTKGTVTDISTLPSIPKTATVMFVMSGSVTPVTLSTITGRENMA